MPKDALDNTLAVARRVLQTEIAGLAALVDELDGRFSQAVDLLAAAKGRVTVTGMGKSGHIARKVVQHFHVTGPAPSRSEELSPREREVLDLLASGYIYKEIGDQLGISPETVRTYVKNICEKMHVRSRLEAVGKHRAG